MKCNDAELKIVPDFGTRFWKIIPDDLMEISEGDAFHIDEVEVVPHQFLDDYISFKNVITGEVHSWSKRVWTSVYPNLIERIYWTSFEEAKKSGLKDVPLRI